MKFTVQYFCTCFVRNFVLFLVKWRDGEVGRVLGKRRNGGDTGGKLYVDERVEGLRMLIGSGLERGSRKGRWEKGGRDEGGGRKKER
jgi:hypothetical protein